MQSLLVRGFVERYLEDNEVGDEGMAKFSEALSSGALPALEVLSLRKNKVGDEGMVKFSEALSSGALALMQVSWLPNALTPCPELSCVNSPDPEVLFGVQYAGSPPIQQPDW